MLTAFKPQSIIELKKQDKSKIESLLSYRDRLLVGLNTGVLRIYRLNENTAKNADNEDATPSKAKAAELLREEESFSKKPIQQLAVIKEAALLIALSDGHVCFYNLEDFSLTERLERTKGASCFAAISYVVKDEHSDIISIHSRLAVAVKRKLLLWSWHHMEMDDKVSELAVPTNIRSLTWINGTRVIVGMDSGYTLVDFETQQMTEILRPAVSAEATAAEAAKFGAVQSSGMSYMGMSSWSPKPLAAKLSEDEMLLAKDVNTLFIDPNGQAIQRRQVPWLAAPDAIGYSYPYLISLQPAAKGVLEIRNPETTSLLQSIHLQNAGLLNIPQQNTSLAHAGKGFLVASERCIWRMTARGYSSQIDELIRESRFDEALSFVSLLEDTLLLDKHERLREIKMLKAESLFASRRYRDALDLFADVSAPPARVIPLYPPVIAGALSHANGPDEDAKPQTDHPGGPVTPQKNIFDRLASVRGSPRTPSRRRDSDAASVRSHKRGKSDVSDTAADHALEGRELMLAGRELNAFLAQTRAQLQKYIDYDGSIKEGIQVTSPSGEPPVFHTYIDERQATSLVDWATEIHKVAVLTDTTLFRSYMLVSPALAGSLFRIDNFCDPSVVQEKLYETGRYEDLIDFLQGKKKHREALDLLQKFGKSSEESTEDAGVDESLRGPQRTISYLQQLPFELIDLILKYAEWPLDTAPEPSMQIFLADTQNAESLPRDRVLHFLSNISARLGTRYLEHVVNEWHDRTPDFHQRLVASYVDRLKQSDLAETARSELQSKLEAFLSASTEYNKHAALPLMPESNPLFHRSRAILFSKLTRHREALSVYVFDLSSPPEAESYCNRIYVSTVASPTAAFSHIRAASRASPSPSSTATFHARNDTGPASSSSSDNIYTLLLSLYLTPPPPHAANLDAALDLLSRHGSRLPALSTLNLIPHSLPIRDLEAYFRGRMRAANSTAREDAIVAALAEVARDAADMRLRFGAGGGSTGDGENSTGVHVRGRGARVVVGENRLCGVCHKRFGRQAIRVWPDGGVVHYGCGDGGGGGGGGGGVDGGEGGEGERRAGESGGGGSFNRKAIGVR